MEGVTSESCGYSITPQPLCRAKERSMWNSNPNFYTGGHKEDLFEKEYFFIKTQVDKTLVRDKKFLSAIGVTLYEQGPGSFRDHK